MPKRKTPYSTAAVVARVARGLRQAGYTAVEVRPDGTIVGIVASDDRRLESDRNEWDDVS